MRVAVKFRRSWCGCLSDFGSAYFIE